MAAQTMPGWIYRHRVWLWTLTIIVGYFWLTSFFYDIAKSADLEILEVYFWDESSESVRNLVLVIGGWLGLLAAIIGFVFSGFRTAASNTQAEAALKQNEAALRQAELAFESQVTERFTKAVEQLGHNKRAVRLGAIYALERIAKDSARDRDTIVETLAAYIRELAPWTPPSDEALSRADDDIENEYLRPRYLGEALEGIPRLAIDIEAALKVICRLLPSGDPMREKIDLSQTDLTRLDASHLNLSYMNFIDVNLYGASFKYANLNHTQLQRSVLSWATLLNADLQWANLTLASLYETNLNGAWLSGTSLA